MDWFIVHWKDVLAWMPLLIYVITVRYMIKSGEITKATIDDIRKDHRRLIVGLNEFDKTMNTVIVSSLPREGFPHQVEACWEDIGARGRYLTDLGGMSIKMREQMFKEFVKALNKPIPTTPAAGSFNDIILDMDAWLTKQAIEEGDEFVLVRRKIGE